MPPYPDSPDKGTISVGIEKQALASPEFESGPPREDAIELSRVVDRGIREGGTLKFEDLLIREGELAWTVFIDAYIINDDGNLFDACSIAALKSLLNAKIPKMEDDKIIKGEYSGKLKVYNKPILSTFAKISNIKVLDPTILEEKAMDSRFSVATVENDKISAFQKALGGTFSEKDIDEMIDIAFKNSKKIRKML
jgi:exosome complex component RRP42